MQRSIFKRKYIVFFSILSCFLFLLRFSTIYAQDSSASTERIVPFLDDQGVAVIHLDLRKVDPENWIKSYTEILDEQLTQWGFDRKSCRGIMQEWNALLPKKLPLITEPFNRLTKEAAVLDLYFVIPFKKTDGEDIWPFLVFPMKDKTEKQKQTLREIVRDLYQWSFSDVDEEPACEEFQDALIAPLTDEMPVREDAESVRQYLEAIKPIDALVLAEAWKGHADDLIRGVILPPNNLSERIAEIGEGGQWNAEPIKSFAEFFQNDLRWISFGFNSDELRFRNVIQLTNEAAAESFTERLQILIGEITKQIEQNTKEHEFFQFFSRLATTSFEEVTRQVMPKQEGDQIVSTVDSSNFMLYYSAICHLGLLAINE